MSVLIKLYKEEVKELTELFRTEWEDIRSIAEEYNLKPNEDYLLAFIEGEDESEICLFFSTEKGLFLYDKNDGKISFDSVSQEDVEVKFKYLKHSFKWIIQK